MIPLYGRLIRGTLIQESALTSSGSEAESSSPDVMCARDGRGRFVITGSSLAGALNQTAAKICRELFSPEKLDNQTHWNRVTGKTTGKPTADDEVFVQSLWNFDHAYHDEGHVEWRQGVGIRQATGAAALEKGVLFDVETLPAGGRWDFFLDIDAHRIFEFCLLGARTEEDQRRARETARDVIELATLALWEWVEGRCWLGGNAARGQGWLRLDRDSVETIDLKPEQAPLWPSNEFDTIDATWAALSPVGAASTGLTFPQETLDRIGSQRFHYLTLDYQITVGGREENGAEFGCDIFTTGGHSTPGAPAPTDHLTLPPGVDAEDFLADFEPDNVLSTTQQGTRRLPILPGSGARGSLRHRTTQFANAALANSALANSALANSALANSESADDTPQYVSDPNDNQATIPDPSCTVSQLFGFGTQSGRLLVRDGIFADDFRLISLHHHAEDEFAGGVFGTSKFERSSILSGKVPLRLVIEADSQPELVKLAAQLSGALQSAEMGMLPIGAGKWRGSGWPTWRLTSMSYCQAGDREPQTYTGTTLECFGKHFAHAENGNE